MSGTLTVTGPVDLLEEFAVLIAAILYAADADAEFDDGDDPGVDIEAA